MAAGASGFMKRQYAHPYIQERGVDDQPIKELARRFAT